MSAIGELMSFFGKIVPKKRQVGDATDPNPANAYSGDDTTPNPEMVAKSGQQFPASPDVRPRVVPNVPINYANSPEAQYNGGVPGAMPSTLNSVPTPQAPDPLMDQFNAINNKDYSIRKDPNTGQVIYRGADREKHFSTGDKILGALEGAGIGFLKGGPLGAIAGGIQGGTDRNYRDEVKDRMAMNRIVPKLEARNAVQKMGQDRQLEQANIDYTNARPQILQQTADQGDRRLDLTADKNAADAEYKKNLISLGKTKADNIKSYRDQIIDLKQQGANQNDDRIRILQQKADEEVRHNQVAEKQQAANEAGRNRRAATSQSGMNARSQRAIAARRALAEYNAAQRSNNIDKMNAARQKLADLKAREDADIQ